MVVVSVVVVVVLQLELAQSVRISNRERYSYQKSCPGSTIEAQRAINSAAATGLCRATPHASPR